MTPSEKLYREVQKPEPNRKRVAELLESGARLDYYLITKGPRPKATIDIILDYENINLNESSRLLDIILDKIKEDPFEKFNGNSTPQICALRNYSNSLERFNQSVDFSKFHEDNCCHYKDLSLDDIEEFIKVELPLSWLQKLAGYLINRGMPGRFISIQAAIYRKIVDAGGSMAAGYGSAVLTHVHEQQLVMLLETPHSKNESDDLLKMHLEHLSVGDIKKEMELIAERLHPEFIGRCQGRTYATDEKEVAKMDGLVSHYASICNMVTKSKRIRLETTIQAAIPENKGSKIKL